MKLQSLESVRSPPPPQDASPIAAAIAKADSLTCSFHLLRPELALKFEPKFASKFEHVLACESRGKHRSLTTPVVQPVRHLNDNLGRSQWQASAHLRSLSKSSQHGSCRSL